MRKLLVIILTSLVCLTDLVYAQSTSETSTNQIIEKASFKTDLDKALWENLSYPQEAFLNRVSGDVILSFKINTNGKVEDINVISTPAEILSASSVHSLEGTLQGWNPCKVNNVPIDKTYLLVYRYRLLTNSNQINIEKKADKLVQKGKLEKALKIYDDLIEDNKFDCNLFEKRAKTNELLGNVESANTDMEQALKLKNGVISTINVNVISYKSAPRYIGTTVVREKF